MLGLSLSLNQSVITPLKDLTTAEKKTLNVDNIVSLSDGSLGVALPVASKDIALEDQVDRVPTPAGEDRIASLCLRRNNFVVSHGPDRRWLLQLLGQATNEETDQDNADGETAMVTAETTTTELAPVSRTMSKVHTQIKNFIDVIGDIFTTFKWERGLESSCTKPLHQMSTARQEVSTLH